MGWTFRKSVSVGPFRFNLSQSGVGMSVGVPGFRVGTGPRGNYVRMGLGGVTYQQTLAPAAPRQPALTPALVSAGTHAPMQEIESAGAAQIVDSSSEQLLEEIREKRRAMTLFPLAMSVTHVLLLFAFGAGWPNWAIGLLLVAGVVATSAARVRDRVRKTAVILYDFEPAAEEAFRHFTEWAAAVAASARTWHLAASAHVYDRKYHAGANQLYQRTPTALRNVQPPSIRTNVPVLGVGVGRQTLYFLPDRLLIYDRNAVDAVSYGSLSIEVAASNFIEEGPVPNDATVVGWTWRYVNRNGGPDRRFSNNPRIPICRYEELRLRTASGLNEHLQISRAGLGDGFRDAVRHLASAAR